jgi:hypothetical protein
VEKSQYDLCIEVLRRLDKAGILKDIVLVGSWCTLFYKKFFSGQKFGKIELFRNAGSVLRIWRL